MLPLIIAGTALGATGLAAQYAAATRDPAKVNAYKTDKRNLEEQDEAALHMADADANRALEARGMQKDVYGRYAAMADGKGPSVAREMARQGANQAQANANQLAASVRGNGGNVLLANRNATKVGAEAQMTASGQSAQLGQQEQIAAMGAMGNLAGDIRSGDNQSRSLSEARASDRSRQLTQLEMGDQQAEMMAQEQNAKYKDKQTDRWADMGKNLTSSGGNMIAKGL